MRCLSIADAFKRKLKDSVFVLADNTFQPLIEERGYVTHILNSDYRDMDSELDNMKKAIAFYQPEMIIADMLDEVQIPFLYEKPLKLGTWTIHPDFTLLDISNRREIYWEHFGMMDDMDYRNDAFSKMGKYEECGFYQYNRLIWTFETGKQPLNTKVLRRMLIQLAKTLGYEV